MSIPFGIGIDQFNSAPIPELELERNWNGIGAELERNWSGIGAELERNWSGIGAELERNWSGIYTSPANNTVRLPLDSNYGQCYSYTNKLRGSITQSGKFVSHRVVVYN